MLNYLCAYTLIYPKISLKKKWALMMPLAPGAVYSTVLTPLLPGIFHFYLFIFFG